MKTLCLTILGMLASGGVYAAAPSYTYIEVGYSSSDILNLEPELYLNEVDNIFYTDENFHEDSMWTHALVSGGPELTIEKASVSASIALGEMFYVFGDYSEDADGVLNRGYDMTIDPLRFIEHSTLEATIQAYSFGGGFRGRFFDDSSTWHYEMGLWESNQSQEYYSDYSISLPQGKLLLVEGESHHVIDNQVQDGTFTGFGIRSNVVDSLEFNAGLRYYLANNEDPLLQARFGAVYSPEWAYGIGLTANVHHTKFLTTFGVGIRYTFL